MHDHPKAKKYLSAKLDNGETIRQDAYKWEKVTGKSAHKILEHRLKNERGEVIRTDRQIVGLDDFDYKQSLADEKRMKKARAVVCEDIIARYLRKTLVPQ